MKQCLPAVLPQGWCAGVAGGCVHRLCMFTAQPRCQVILPFVVPFWTLFTDLTPGPLIPLGMVYILQVYGKYLGFHCSFSVMVLGGCNSQGCHGYPLYFAWFVLLLHLPLSCTIPRAHLLLMGFTGATCYCTVAGLFCTVAWVSLACVHL